MTSHGRSLARKNSSERDPPGTLIRHEHEKATAREYSRQPEMGKESWANLRSVSMAQSTVKDFQEDLYLRVIRPLVRAYSAFYRLGSRHIEKMGITPAQFDVLAELGGTSGMTCADLSQATLITKGTLTGVLDRLEEKGLLMRCAMDSDRRAIQVKLTSRGKSLYRRIFPAHGAYLRSYLKGAFSPREIASLSDQLSRLRKAFENHEPSPSGMRRKRSNGKTR